MSAIASYNNLMSSGFSTCVTTGATEDSALASSPSQKRGREWQDFIDYQLLEMGRLAGPTVADDDEDKPPTRQSIKAAIRLAQVMAKDTPWNVPNRLSCTGAGGVSFEWD